MSGKSEVNENNRLIAEFMGIKPVNYYANDKRRKPFWIWNIPEHTFQDYNDLGEACGISDAFSEIELKYHTSWDWLMPVVEKISKMQFPDGDYSYPRTFGMTSDNGKFLFRFNRFSVWEHSELITSAYLAVVEFVEWYNQQPPPPPPQRKVKAKR